MSTSYVASNVITVTTDPLSLLQIPQGNIQFTQIGLLIINQSDDNAQYRITGTNSPYASTDVTVNSGQQQNATVTALVPNTKYQFSLFRNEFNTYVPQGGTTESVAYSECTTLSSSLNTSKITSSTVTVSWNQGYIGAVFELDVMTLDNSGTVISGTTKVIANSSISAVSGTCTSMLNLAPLTSYKVNLNVIENNVTSILDSKVVTTSDTNKLELVQAFASYISLKWSASMDSQRIAYSMTGGSILYTPSAISSSVLVPGLTPGIAYNLTLQTYQQIDVSGTMAWIDEGTLSVTTLIAALTVNSVGSGSARVSWNSLYTGAIYQAQITSTNPAYSAFSSDTFTTDVAATFIGLSPKQAYDIVLYIKENGSVAPLSTAHLVGSEPDEVPIATTPSKNADAINWMKKTIIIICFVCVGMIFSTFWVSLYRKIQNSN